MSAVAIARAIAAAIESSAHGGERRSEANRDHAQRPSTKHTRQGKVVMGRHMHLPKDLTAECRNAAGTGQVVVKGSQAGQLLARNAGGNNCKQASNKSGKRGCERDGAETRT